MNEDIQNKSSNRGNEKQTRTTLENIKFVLLWMSHLLKVAYTSRTSYRVLNLVFFSRARGGGTLSLRKGANSKRSAYLKMTQSFIPLRGLGGMEETKVCKVTLLLFFTHPYATACGRHVAKWIKWITFLYREGSLSFMLWPWQNYSYFSSCRVCI